MLSIAQSQDFVKQQRDFYVRELVKLKSKANSEPSTPASKRALEKLPLHERLCKGFEQLNQAIEEDLAKNLKALDEPSANATSDLASLLTNPTDITPSALDGLPDDLIQQLQISESDRFQWMVIDLIDRTPEKMISIEVLLIALFKITEKIYERGDLANRMYRLSRKNAVYPVSGRKGIYTTIPQTDLLEPSDLDKEPES
ncbi:MAG: hypothetical protein EAZ37_13330 [Burkholderiales bacterium]|nr:MAG: hypothetical protein EAZ37_13330 [Burkholderiales bacterium]